MAIFNSYVCLPEGMYIYTISSSQHSSKPALLTLRTILCHCLDVRWRHGHWVALLTSTLGTIDIFYDIGIPMLVSWFQTTKHGWLYGKDFAWNASP